MKKKQNQEHGVAIIELALLFPLLVLVIVGGLEFSRALQRYQIAAALSRETASIGYREALADPAGDPALQGHDNPITGQDYAAEMNLKLNGCITCDASDPVNYNSSPFQVLRQSAKALVPGSEVRVSVFRYGPVTRTVKNDDGTTSTNTSMESVAFQSNYDLDAAENYNYVTDTFEISNSGDGKLINRLNPDLDATFPSSGHIVVGEAWVPFDSIMFYVWSVLNINAPRAFYDASVIMHQYDTPS